MSLRPHVPAPVPEETARVARAAFPTSSPYIRMRDQVDTIYQDMDLTQLFPTRGKPAESPWRLALVTIFQFAEHLSDRQAADAVRGRIDWKYALSLDLTDPGFDYTVLSEFRSRLLAGGAEQVLLDVLVERFRELGLFKIRGCQRTDSTHVLAAVRALNRLESVRETLRHTLDVLDNAAPEWLRTHVRIEWVQRYRHRSDAERLPQGKEAQRERADQIGRDAEHDLFRRRSGLAPQVPAVETLRRIWVQNELNSKTGSTCWVGYTVALTETCEEETPNLMTHVETVTAPTADGVMTPTVHRDLQQRDLLPAIHLVDTGLLDAGLLVESRRDFGVELLGPTRRDQRWQARSPAGFRVADFVVDFDRCTATCPEGKQSCEWIPRVDNRGNDSSSTGARRLTAAPARVVSRVPDRRPSTSGGRSPSARNRSMTHYGRDGTSRRVGSISASMLGGRGLRAPSRRVSGAAGSAVPATLVSPVPISGMC